MAPLGSAQSLINGHGGPYRVDSIRDIGEGMFSSGPWDDELLTVEGERLTLNDVEHRIIRPISQDERIHYVVTCASGDQLQSSADFARQQRGGPWSYEFDRWRTPQK